MGGKQLEPTDGGTIEQLTALSLKEMPLKDLAVKVPVG
jgi:hypothetical protein